MEKVKGILNFWRGKGVFSILSSNGEVEFSNIAGIFYLPMHVEFKKMIPSTLTHNKNQCHKGGIIFYGEGGRLSVIGGRQFFLAPP